MTKYLIIPWYCVSIGGGCGLQNIQSLLFFQSSDIIFNMDSECQYKFLLYRPEKDDDSDDNDDDEDHDNDETLKRF